MSTYLALFVFVFVLFLSSFCITHKHMHARTRTCTEPMTHTSSCTAHDGAWAGFFLDETIS